MTNALKHAGDAHVKVTLDYTETELTIDVVDDGRGPTRANGGGHGLVGMRERVSLYGGHLDAGPCSGGGFAVHAVLPLTAGSRA